MLISKRKYYCNALIALYVAGVLIILSAPVANKYLFHIALIDEICKCIMIGLAFIAMMLVVIILCKNKGIKGYVEKHRLLRHIEDNLISIGAYIRIREKCFVELPKIIIAENMIRIKLKDLRIRTAIERYINTFSTALPDKYVVEDYYITQNSAEIVIAYENIKNYKPEKYKLSDYVRKIKSLSMLSLYFDKKHIVNVNDYPHFLISGASGSGKTYLANELVVQAIIKEWEVVILDVKRSYGLYKAFSDYYYEMDDILQKLKSVEAEMYQRMEKLQPLLDENPRALAVDIGYMPMLVVIEEYISLQSSLDKKKKEELERVVKNISVLARQSNIHLMIVMQAAGTENIQATTRSNLTKILLGNAQSNIMTATFGNGIDIRNMNTKLNKGEGLIQLDRITLLRVPQIDDIDEFKNVIGRSAEG